MRLVLCDLQSDKRRNFYPIALSRPIWDLRCGMTSLGEKLIAKSAAKDVACFVPSYMAEYWKTQTTYPVNDPASLKGSDLLLVNPTLKAAGLGQVDLKGASHIATNSEGCALYCWVKAADTAKLDS